MPQGERNNQISLRACVLIIFLILCGTNVDILRGKDDQSESRVRRVLDNNAIDEKYGFTVPKESGEKIGYLINMHTVKTFIDNLWGCTDHIVYLQTEVLDAAQQLISAVDYFFVQEDGSRFKASLVFRPYFYILPRKECLAEVATFLSKKYAGVVVVENCIKEDLDLARMKNYKLTCD